MCNNTGCNCNQNLDKRYYTKEKVDRLIDKFLSLQLGPKGDEGVKGDQGDVGPRGEKGDKGDPATNYVSSVAGRIGDVVLTESDIDGLTEALNLIRSAISERVVDENGKSLVSNALINKLTEDYTKVQIDNLLATIDSNIDTLDTKVDDEVDSIHLRIDNAFVNSVSSFLPVTGITLPTLAPDQKAFSLVGPGVYSGNNQSDIIISSAEMGLIVAENGKWMLVSTLVVPDDVLAKIAQQKGIPGGIAPLTAGNLIPDIHINAYSKTVSDDRYVAQVFGKGLTTNDFTNTAKEKVDSLEIDGDGKMVLANDGTYKKFSADGGGGFYNITQKSPLEEGAYYTLATAVNVLSTLDISDESRVGMIITFESNSGHWEDYRFTGDVSNFLNPNSWEEFQPKDLLKGVRFNGEVIEKDSAGIVNIDVNTTVEETVDPNSTNPVASNAVAAKFNEIGSKYGTSLTLTEIGEGQDKRYSIALLDENDNVLSSTSEFSGGGGGQGDSSSTRIILTKITQNQVIKEGDDLQLEYFFDHREVETGVATGLSGEATITIASGAVINTRTQRISTGNNLKLDVGSLVKVGNNTIRIRVAVDTGEAIQISSIAWNIQVVALKLTSSFDWAIAFAKGSSINVPYNLSGSGTKSIRLFLNGLEVDSRNVSNSFSSGSFTINTALCHHGSNSIQMVAEMIVGEGKVIPSNSIYFEVAIHDMPDNMEPMIATRFDYPDGRIIERGDVPVLLAKKFNDYDILYAGYNPEAISNRVTIRVGGSVVSDLTTTFIQRVFRRKSIATGETPASISIGSIVYNFNIVVADSGVALQEPTDNIKFVLKAIGRSNEMSDREVWMNNGVTTTFSGFKFSGDGWINDALRLLGNASAVVNYKPLSIQNASKQNAFAFTVRFRTSNLEDSSLPLISCMDGEVGFEIKADSIVMNTAGNSEVIMRTAPEQTYNIALVSFPIANINSSDYEKLNSGMIYLYIDGIMSGCVQRGEQEDIYQQNPADITLTGTGATLEVFSMRCYDNYLSDSQVLDIHILDLDTADAVEKAYDFNNVIDDNGNVTVDSIPKDMRYIIITGAQANGMSTVDFAAAMNNKDARYDVQEILHIKKSQPELNFRLEGGCIRLQGTSSLAYPIKNYRFYFKNAAKQAGRLTIGVDENGAGGALSSTPKFSFKLANDKGKLPAPVDCWCLKADFAESSSSHNTGMARLTNDVLQAAGDLTPAQKYVDSEFTYDVRTTVDGEPCYLFHRNTLEDQPVFVGKYNMNNDKSTEAVFGFLDIPGYHDAEWVTTKFGGENPTECWEFLNNDYPMGMYLDDDFTSKDLSGLPNWRKVFENRFPDNNEIYDSGDVRPQYLENFVKWVKSTQNDGTKFRNELANYMDVNHLCSYYMFTEIFGAVDQRVKNAMLGFWYNPDVDKVLGYYIFYDNDTILGLRNDGRLKYGFDVDHNTLDPELTASAGKDIYAYAGHDSVLWKNLREQFAPELQASYKRLRAVMTNDYILKMFNDEQTSKFAERIYNIDAQYKYIKPKTLGIDVIVNGEVFNTKYSYLEAMQGSRKAHLRWWIVNRLENMDAKYSAGQYTQTDITWKGISAIGAKVSAIPSKDYYLEVRREGDTMQRGLVLKGNTWSYTYNQTANIGTIFHLFGGKFIKHLDLSEWGGFTDINFPVLPNLNTLILGRTGRTYTLTELVLSGKLPMLKRLDLVNYVALSSLDLRNEKLLQELNASGCNSLTSIQFAEGAPLEKLVLPANLRTLTLRGVELENEDITFPQGNGVTRLIVESAPNINWQTLVASCPNLTHIRLTNITGEGLGEELTAFIGMKGIGSNGEVVNYPAVSGTYTLTGFPDNYDQLIATFPLIQFIEPEFSYISFTLDVQTPKTVTNHDNNTGYLFTSDYRPSGHIKKILDARYRCLGKQTADGKMSIAKLHEKNSHYFYNNGGSVENASPATLDGSQGDVFVYEPRFWYKSLTDGFKTYLAVSTNQEKPANPDPANYRVVKINTSGYRGAYSNDLVEGALIWSTFGLGQLTVGASVASNPSGTSMKVNVKGYKKALTTHMSVTNPNATTWVMLFADASNIVVARKTVFIGEHNYLSARHIRTIVDIPENAEWMYVSWDTNDPSKVPNPDEIVLSKTDNIWDLAVTDWQLHTPELIASVPVVSNPSGSKIGSFKTTNGVIYNTSINDLKSISLTNRKLDIISYHQHKTLAMVALMGMGAFKYGDVIGYTSGSQVKPGDTFSFGMQSSFIVNGNTNFKRPDGTNVSSYAAAFSGYESLGAGTYEVLRVPQKIKRTVAGDPVMYPTNSKYKWTITDGYKTEEFIFASTSGIMYSFDDRGKFNFGAYTHNSGTSSPPSQVFMSTDCFSAEAETEADIKFITLRGTTWAPNVFSVNTFNTGNTHPNNYVSTQYTTRVCFPFSDRINTVSVNQFNQITNFL